MPTTQRALRFPGTIPGFEGAAVALRDLLGASGIAAGVRYNVELVFEEIASNIVRYGSPRDPVDVAIAFLDDEIVLTFEDDGVPFDPRQHPEPEVPRSIDEAIVGGLGL